MSIVRLQGSTDPRIDDYRAVSEPRLATERGVFVAEGRLVVSRLIRARRFVVRSLLVTDTAWQSLENDWTLLGPDVPVYLAASSDLSEIAGVRMHRGCLALGERPVLEGVETLLRQAGSVVVLEGVGNPDNIGGIFRNALAFGVDAVVLSPTCGDPLYRKAIRTSMGAAFEVPFTVVHEWPAPLSALAAMGFDLIALNPSAPLAIDDLPPGSPLPSRHAILLGGEGHGLSEAANRHAKLSVRIPMSDGCDSLNVAVASGIALFQLWKARCHAG
jgi:tRNA G18 (ribose-2'-O)-methylase SpoU